MSVNKNKINNFIQDRGGFTMIPNELYEIAELDFNDIVIWSYIYSRASGWASSQGNVARNLSLHPNTVAKHVVKLVELGMLATSQGANNAQNYEILAPDQWKVTTRGCGAINGMHHSPEHTRPHGDVIGSASPQGTPKKEEEKKGENKNPLPPLREKKAAEEKETQETIILSWKGESGDIGNFLSFKNAPQYLSGLVETFAAHGYTPDEIDQKLVIKLLFGKNPSPKMVSWSEDVLLKLKEAVVSAKSIKVYTGTPAGMSARAKEIYDGLVAKGITPDDLNGLPLVEYALQRENAEGFHIVNTDSLKKRIDCVATAEELAAAAGIT
jgi:hypothetical protein